MTNNDPKNPKLCFKYKCLNCNYFTSVKKDYNKHLLTQKHIKRTNDDQTEIKSNFYKSKNKENLYICKCGKQYKYKQGLSFHKKSCLHINQPVTETDANIEINELKDIIKNLIVENGKLQKQMCEIIPKIGINNNIQNNKFNIQVFLNEQCKDAINMSDFVKSIQVSLLQLDYIKQNGLVNGLSNVIIENINKLGLYERPIHCTDIKRETLYIKDDDNWEKDINKQKIKKVIKDVSTKQFYALNNWTKENPDFQNDEHKQNYYTHTLVAIANNKEHNEDKIIKKLCNNSYIKE